MSPDDLTQLDGGTVNPASFEDPHQVVVALSRTFYQRGRRTIAAAQARGTLNLHPVRRTELGCYGLEAKSALHGSPQVARLVAADADHDFGWWLQPEMREKRDNFVQAVQRHAKSSRDCLKLLSGQVSASFLNGTQTRYEH
jgi:hypothetical protein